MKHKIAIVIVSYNRRELVLNNIAAVKRSSHKEFTIILFDNGSTDNTIEGVKELHPEITIIASKENLGGAGGFAKAMEHAYTNGFDFIWCLDDDGCPKEDCLEILLKEYHTYGNNTILGPTILPSNANESQHFWPIHGKYDASQKIIVEFSENEKQDLRKTEASFETASVALLGMFMHRSVIEQNGLPTKEIFISGDDIDYCLRAWQHNMKVVLVQKAIIYHPLGKSAKLSFFGKNIEFFILTPWKLYYYIRNSIYVHLVYFRGLKLIKVVLLSFIIIFHHLIRENDKFASLKYGMKGIFHGLKKKLGKVNF